MPSLTAHAEACAPNREFHGHLLCFVVIFGPRSRSGLPPLKGCNLKQNRLNQWL
jgi:hypothetical protein